MVVGPLEGAVRARRQFHPRRPGAEGAGPSRRLGEDRSALLSDGFGDEPLAVEYRIVLPGGETRWIYALGAAARGENGVATAVHGIHLDVTQRKRSEEMLDEARRQLGMALESAKLGIWTIDPNSGEVWYSDRSRELYGVEPDAPIDVRSLKRLIHPDDWPRVNEPYLLGFPNDTISIEHRVLRPDGETVGSIRAAQRFATRAERW